MSRLQKKKILKWAAILGSIAVLLIGGLLITEYFGKENSNREQQTDQEVEQKLLEEAYEAEITDDMRLHKYTFIKLTERMKKGDYVDIRVSFPNGADFVLLSKKQIQDISIPLENAEENALWLYVTEEEILRLSSAVVDAFLDDGCSVYAVQYIKDEQKAAIMNYKVNDVVAQLIADDPNIVKKAENVLEWELWNEWKAEGNTLSLREEAYAEAEETTVAVSEQTSEDEIVYFD